MKKGYLSLVFIFIGAFIFCIGIYYLSGYLREQAIQDKDLLELKKEKEKFDRQQALKTKYKLETHIRFLYGLTIKDSKPADNFDVGEDYIVPFSNPYEKTYNDLEFSNTSNKNQNTRIENKTNSDLIIFKLIKGIDETVFIPKDEAAFIKIEKKDTLVFYYGDRFINTYFSHFKENTGISALYEVESLTKNLPETITVNTFETVNSGSKKRKLQKKYTSINFNTINVKELPHINDLYSDYYKKNYRK
jgi:hypothetical protein